MHLASPKIITILWLFVSPSLFCMKRAHEDSLSCDSINRIKIVSIASTGRDHSPNEDRYFVNMHESTDDFSCVVICDGHNGSGWANYARDNLYKCLKDSCVDNRNIKFSDHVIKSAFKKLSNTKNQTPEDQKLSLKQRNPNKLINKHDQSGTTATAVFFVQEDKDWVIYIAHVGDSRAVLGSSNQECRYKELCQDHRPSNTNEIKRLQKYDYWQGKDLAAKWQGKSGVGLTRCFGHSKQKSLGLICEPEVCRHLTKPEDKFIILATDGLWDLISSEEAVNFVGNNIQTPEKIADSLLVYALKKHVKHKEASACLDIKKEAQENLTQLSRQAPDDITIAIIVLTDEA